MEENKSLSVEGVEAMEDQAVVNDEQKYHHHHSEHSHHHRHHRRHHYRSNSSKRKKKKTVAFLKKHRGALVNLLSCMVSVVFLVIMALNIDFFPEPSGAENNYVDVTRSTIRIETSIYPEKILIVSNAISYYMSPDNDATANEVYKSFEGYKKTLNVGLPLIFTYRVTGLPSGVKVRTAVLEISENNDYQKASTYILDLDDSILDIYNLKTGTKYTTKSI